MYFLSFFRFSSLLCYLIFLFILLKRSIQQYIRFPGTKYVFKLNLSFWSILFSKDLNNHHSFFKITVLLCHDSCHASSFLQVLCVFSSLCKQLFFLSSIKGKWGPNGSILLAVSFAWQCSAIQATKARFL